MDTCTHKCIETRVPPFVFELEGHRQFQWAQHRILGSISNHTLEDGKRTKSRASFNGSHASISICHVWRNYQLPFLSNTHTTCENTSIEWEGVILQQSLVPPFDHLSCTKFELKWTSPTLRLLLEMTNTDHMKNQKLHHSRKVSPYPLLPTLKRDNTDNAS